MYLFVQNVMHWMWLNNQNLLYKPKEKCVSLDKVTLYCDFLVYYS